MDKVEIIKTKFFCKNGCKSAVGDRFTPTIIIPSVASYSKALANVEWYERFIEGVWYDGEYETWSPQLYKLNNGWKRYWVFNENGIKEEISRDHMEIIFETGIKELREQKINEILNY